MYIQEIEGFYPKKYFEMDKYKDSKDMYKSAQKLSQFLVNGTDFFSQVKSGDELSRVL